MPKYDVTAPDGQTWEVEAPDGASEADVLAYAREKWGGQRKQAPVPRGVADDVGAVEAAMIAAGKTTARIGQGLKQAYYTATGDDAAQAALREQVTEEDRLYEPLAKARPLATGIGGALPMLAVPVGGAGAVTMMARSAAAAAAPELLSYGSVEDRLKRGGVAAAGGAAGGGLGLLAGRLLKPAGAVAGASDDALEAARRIGVKPLAGQVTQNPAVQNFENYLTRSIGSSGRMLKHNQANQTALNRAAAKAMGVTADDLGEGVMGQARSQIGQQFDHLQSITGPDMARPEFMRSLIAVDSANIARGPYASAKITKEIDKALDLAAQGKISGKAYKEIHSELASASSSAFRSGDATLGQAIKTIREAMDDAAKASLGAADQKAWDTVRKQWSAYKVLVKGNVAEAGDVSAARVASKLRADPRFRTGGQSGELADIARVGEAFKSVQNPNSGQLAKPQIDTLFGLLRAGADNAAGGIYMSRPMQAYLTNGLPIGANSRHLLGRSGSLLGVPAGYGLLGVE